MTPHRILHLNALSTALCAVALIATRGILPPLFGLDSATLLDIVAVALLAYAEALVAAARAETVARPALLAFAAVDALWVVGSAVLLVACWGQFTPTARVLVIAVALAVEVFAFLQYRAASGRMPAFRTA